MRIILLLDEYYLQRGWTGCQMTSALFLNLFVTLYDFYLPVSYLLFTPPFLSPFPSFPF